MPTAEILSQGDEVVTGQTPDTNASWLADRLGSLGFDVVRHTVVGDRREDIIALMLEIAARSDVCIGTGGLGPTDDDHTSSAAGEAFGHPLEFHEDTMQQIAAMFARFHRPMADINRKQAYLPATSTRLDNDWGTAPGFAIQHQRCWFAFLPGVPREMKAMFDARVLPHLVEQFALRPGRLVTLRCVGIGESDMQMRAGQLEHPGLVWGTRTMLPENHLKLRFTADVPESEIRAFVDEIVGRIGPAVFAVEGLDADSGGTLAAVIGRRLVALGQTLAVAESCTGGRVAAMCTAVPGASQWFTEGVVAYANIAKSRLLDVSEALLAEHGAVSEPVARAMAEGLRANSGADYTLSVTGIAGPGGGTDAKPVGTVHIAVASPSGTSHRLLRLGGDRGRIQDLAAASALDLVRRTIP